MIPEEEGRSLTAPARLARALPECSWMHRLIPGCGQPPPVDTYPETAPALSLPPQGAVAPASCSELTCCLLSAALAPLHIHSNKEQALQLPYRSSSWCPLTKLSTTKYP